MKKNLKALLCSAFLFANQTQAALPSSETVAPYMNLLTSAVVTSNERGKISGSELGTLEKSVKNGNKHDLLEIVDRFSTQGLSTCSQESAYLEDCLKTLTYMGQTFQTLFLRTFEERQEAELLQPLTLQEGSLSKWITTYDKLSKNLSQFSANPFFTLNSSHKAQLASLSQNYKILSHELIELLFPNGRSK
ncbi:hypothetical protein H6501_04570 [Candidatus Woesearchaeota archaeon]|nr:hypothetical protein [Nanoarchaeota archaeon]MCB9370846.1 hypothetical protein [Candidatus Woesearchaeota archaeon]USN43947.1 MAG: hypothetical protein H6500_06175 [Candidatus Woesearchaeota archaeon]